MSITESASEIDRLYGVHDEAERRHFEATTLISRSEHIREGAINRIDVLFDNIATSIPQTVEEAFALAVALHSQMPDGELEEESATRQRIDRMIDNLMLGLKRLCPSSPMPHWFEEHISAAQNGSSAVLDFEPGCEPVRHCSTSQR